jgi:hypothetical protein
LQASVRFVQVVGRQVGGRVGINTDHFSIPLLFMLFCDFRAASGRFFKVFDPTLLGFPGKLFFGIDFLGRLHFKYHRSMN